MSTSHNWQRGALSEGRWILWAIGTLFVLSLMPRITDLFDGTFPGLDDMMRLQQVRDLLAGQAWFDVNQSRMLTPEGGAMHWSRLPDVFLSAAIVALSPILGPANAEIIAMGVWPLILFAAVLGLICRVSQQLGLGRAGQAFAMLFFTTSAAVYSFWPGRIDHHGLVVVLSLGSLTALLSTQLTARSGLLLAFCVTAAISVALEGLPYALGSLAIMGVFWVVRGHQEGVRLTALGAGLMVFSSLFFLFDAPGLSADRLVCDAYGASHWAAVLFGGMCFIALGIFGGLLDTWRKRLWVGGLLGAGTLAVFILVNPACFADPYADVPEPVRVAWLSAVDEAKTLTRVWADEPWRIIWVFGFLTVATGSAMAMLAGAEPHQGAARIGFTLLLGLSIVATIWQVRGQLFSHMFGAIATAWLAERFFLRWRIEGGAPKLLVFASIAVLCSASTWRALGERLYPSVVAAKDLSFSSECVAPENFQTLVTGEQRRLFSPIDLSIPIMVRTKHSVYAGPYHRNIEGLEQSILILMGDPALAHQRLLDLRATHLVFCQGLGETNLYAKASPESVSAQLNAGQIPAWLTPVDGLEATQGVLRLYRIEP